SEFAGISKFISFPLLAFDFELTVWGKIYIQKNKGKLMNFEILANSDLIQRFIGPPIEVSATPDYPHCSIIVTIDRFQKS
ncbi:hypothetical protein L9F63_011547, partial [Diploptera punctata]